MTERQTETERQRHSQSQSQKGIERGNKKRGQDLFPFTLSPTSRPHSPAAFAGDRSGAHSCGGLLLPARARARDRQALRRPRQVRALEAIRRAATNGDGRVGRAVNAHPHVSGRQGGMRRRSPARMAVPTGKSGPSLAHGRSLRRSCTVGRRLRGR